MLFRLVATLFLGLAGTALAEALPDDADPTASYSEATDRYPHHILGTITGWGVLHVDLSPCAGCAPVRYEIRLAESRVFEDIAPRLWDVTGDGKPEVVVVESDQTKGARLVILQAMLRGDQPVLAQIAATEFLGKRFRWLAPVGVADLDGDGRIEMAYVETPHRDKILRVVRFEDGRLKPVASLSGLTAHRIGAETIEGVVRHCDSLSEIILLSADYARVVAVTLTRGELDPRDLGPAINARLPRSATSC